MKKPTPDILVSHQKLIKRLSQLQADARKLKLLVSEQQKRFEHIEESGFQHRLRIVFNGLWDAMKARNRRFFKDLADHMDAERIEQTKSEIQEHCAEFGFSKAELWKLKEKLYGTATELTIEKLFKELKIETKQPPKK